MQEPNNLIHYLGTSIACSIAFPDCSSGHIAMHVLRDNTVWEFQHTAPCHFAFWYLCCSRLQSVENVEDLPTKQSL